MSHKNRNFFYIYNEKMKLFLTSRRDVISITPHKNKKMKLSSFQSGKICIFAGF